MLLRRGIDPDGQQEHGAAPRLLDRGGGLIGPLAEEHRIVVPIEDIPQFVIDAFVSAGTRDDALGQIINVGCGEDVAICDLVDMIHRETESTSDIQIGALENRPTEIWEMRADIEKCRRLLDWSPQIPFDEGLRKTIEWYRLYRHEFTDPESGIQRLAGMSSSI